MVIGIATIYPLLNYSIMLHDALSLQSGASVSDSTLYTGNILVLAMYIHVHAADTDTQEEQGKGPVVSNIFLEPQGKSPVTSNIFHEPQCHYILYIESTDSIMYMCSCFRHSMLVL